MFEIDVKDMHWITEGDAPDDLCAHGKMIARIGNETFEYDGTVSSTAIYLLKTLTENHSIGEENKMMPCCGHFMIANDNLDNVHILGCDGGFDWAVIHENSETVELITESGNEVTVNIDEYENIVFQFADKVEAFYKSCTPKKIPEDDFEKNGYLAFWTEWYIRRYGDKSIKKHITPDFYKNFPKNSEQYMRAVEFRKKHPHAHKILLIIAVFMLLMPMAVYTILVCFVFKAPNSPLILVGDAGALFIGAGLCSVTAAWIKCYLGHIFTTICLSIGIITVALSCLLLFN